MFQLAKAAFAFLFMLVPPAFAQTVEEPEGYRTQNYKAPVPETLKGATAIGPEAAHALWKTGRVVFVDVLPNPPRPKNLPEGTVWREKVRHSIPDAVWLPNVGFGDLADVTHTYFRDGLTKATSADHGQPIVFFCLDQCWMSWNAAKRALEYGYTRVFWFPQGTDGWSALGHPTEIVKPEPEPDS